MRSNLASASTPESKCGSRASLCVRAHLCSGRGFAFPPFQDSPRDRFIVHRRDPCPRFRCSMWARLPCQPKTRDGGRAADTALLARPEAWLRRLSPCLGCVCTKDFVPSLFARVGIRHPIWPVTMALRERVLRKDALQSTYPFPRSSRQPTAWNQSSLFTSPLHPMTSPSPTVRVHAFSPS